MKKICAAILIAMLALCGTGLAEYLSGDGWWDDSYAGTWVMINNGDMAFKVPQGWTFYETGDTQCYTRPDELQYVVVRWVDEDFRDMIAELDENAAWGMYEESAWIILQEDRDWYLCATQNYVDAICPGDLGGTIWITVVMDGYPSDWAMARRMISSVSSLEQY